MGGSAQPENGADSAPALGAPHRYVGERNRSDDRCQSCGREYADLIHDALSAGKPKPTRAQITLLVLESMPPGTDRAVIDHEVAMVEMADRLGRAIHEAKKVGGPWGPPCMRVKSDIKVSPGALLTEDDFEQVPYGYDGAEYECDCEAMALHLVEEMAKASKQEAN